MINATCGTRISSKQNHFGELKCEIYFSFAVACFLVSIVFAATEPLNVKTGLWQSDDRLPTSGLPPLPADMQARLDKMTPERRARMEAAMKGRLGGTHDESIMSVCNQG